MKVVKASEMARIEKLAYQQGASEEAFMNQAGQGVAEFVQQFCAFHKKPKIAFLCGKGNNAGDAYVAARILRESKFEVCAFAFFSLEESSPLCQLQASRFQSLGGEIRLIKNPNALSFEEFDILVDGLLGTGFHGKVEGVLREVIEKANASSLPLLAIDIPSGVDGNSGEIGSVAIQATETLFLGLPKAGCFLGETWNFVGKVHVYDFGLGKEFINEAQEDFLLIEDRWIERHLPTLKRTQHKYQAGYVVGIGGHSGMPGAPILSSFAALRAGAGIVRLLHPKGMEAELSGAPYEVIREGYKEGDIKHILKSLERATSVFVGPGIGVSESGKKLLMKLLPQIVHPCVIDAEALTLIALHSLTLPMHTILTPHHGEMKRLLHLEKDLTPGDFLEMCQKYVDDKKCVLVLKGAPTFILYPNGKPYLSIRGDPGMATAGSGDVLTGIIAAFLAQKASCLQAALLGVHFHGIAGEYAAEEMTSYSMVASDITEFLPQVFQNFLDKHPFCNNQNTIL